MGPRIYNKRESDCERTARNVKWCKGKAAGKFVKGGNVGTNMHAVCSRGPTGRLPGTYCVHVTCVCASLFECVAVILF